jgi:hypothetical protein
MTAKKYWTYRSGVNVLSRITGSSLSLPNVRRSGRDYHQGAGRCLARFLANGEASGAGHDVEALVVAAVPVLRRSGDVRRSQSVASARGIAAASG